MLFDHHVHPEHGPYTPENYPVEWLEQYVERGRQRKVSGLGLVEHGYRFVEARGLLPTAWAEARCRFSLDAYTAFLDQVRGTLPIAVGLEMDYVPGKEAFIRQYLERYTWDFVLGSVHWLDQFGLDVPEMRSEYAVRGPRAVWQAYYETSTSMVVSGLFDVITHPDLPKIFGDPRPPESFLLPLYRRFVDALLAHGVALEINTGGLRRPVHEIYPDPVLLALAARAGVAISLASDAHEPENVGHAFLDAQALARASGFREILGFRDGERVRIPLT